MQIETEFDRTIRYYRNECSEIECPLVNRAIKEEEYKKLIRQYWDLNRFRVIWELLWSCGMRPVEVCWLQKTNFSEDFSMLGYKQAKYRNVRKNGKIVKTYKSRIVPIPEKLAKKLKEFVEMNKFIIHNGFLFPTLDRERMEKGLFYMNPRTLNFELDTLRQLIGGRFLEKNSNGDHLIAPHSFRRSWIVRHIRKYKNPFKTARNIGHNSVDTTFGYYQEMDMDELVNFVDKSYVDLHIPYLTKEQMTLTSFSP